MQTPSTTQVSVAPRALGYVQVAVGGVDAAATLTTLLGAAIIAKGPTFVVLKASAQAIRIRDDGTPPTAAIGYPVPVNTEVMIDCAQLGATSIIAQVAGAGLDILAYGR
jgi:hypothetical protein